jgi:hypothetical protein
VIYGNEKRGKELGISVVARGTKGENKRRKEKVVTGRGKERERGE